MAKTNSELKTSLVVASNKIAGSAPEAAEKTTINTWLEKSKPEFGKALAGCGMDPDHFIRVCVTVIRKNDTLKKIAINNPVSILGACMDIASVGLDPAIPNEAHIVPYGSEAVPVYGYKGLAKLALRAAKEQGAPLRTLTYDTICKNDEYSRGRGDSPYLTHRLPAFGTPRGEVLGYYAVAQSTDGLINFVEMTIEEVKAHQKRFCKSLTNSRSPFYDGGNFDAYGLKTVVRRLINRYLPMSNRLSQVIASDVDSDEDTPVRLTPDVPALGEPQEGGEQDGQEEKGREEERVLDQN